MYITFQTKELHKNYVGNSLTASIRRIMSALFEDAVLVEYSLKGNKGKKKFNQLMIYKVIKSKYI